MSTKPVCVIAGDIHFTLQTLSLATSVVEQMIAKAKELKVPIVLNGDTLDANAVIRAEIANRLIQLLEPLYSENVFINIGNHDRLNRHGDESSLDFLRPYAHVINSPVFISKLDSYIVPYFHDKEKLQAFLDTVKAGSRLIVHQGVIGAKMGAYVKDTSSLPPEAFKNFRVIASHYHGRQDIKCGRPRKGGAGLFSYIGSAYTVTGAESGDGIKGVSVLYDDGTLELIPTNLRKHVTVELHTEDTIGRLVNVASCDIIRLKLSGSPSELDRINKRELGMKLFGTDQYRLDKIPTEVTRLDEKVEKFTDIQIIDKLIDKGQEPAAEKANLKALTRELLDEAG